MLVTAQDAFALRCAISLQPIPNEIKPSPLLAGLLSTLDWQNNPDHRLILQNLVTTQAGLLEQVMKVDVKAPPVEEPICDELYVPPLPKAAELDESLIKKSADVGRFQRDCADWLARKSPMTPRIFLESAPLWAAGLAIAKRCVLRLSFDDIYPNLYVLWVAPTTYYHKSTGLKAITKLVGSSFQHLLMPETTTPEMLVAKLAGQRPSNYEQLLPSEKKLEDTAIRFAGQRGLSIDEASKILIPKKYMEGHAEALMQLFDAPDRMERELRGDGKLIVYNPALSLIGATTPAMLSRYLTDAEWESGLMARIIPLTPAEKEVKYVVSTHSPELQTTMETLKNRLLRIHNAFPTPPDWDALYSSEDAVRLKMVEALLEPSVMNRFNAYSEAMHELTDPRRGLDERLRGNYGRLPVLAIKLALILTIMDWADEGGKESPRITEAHWTRAQMLSEEYRASAHRLLAELNISQDVKNEQKILDFIARTQGTKPPTKREIHRGAGIKNRKDAHSAVEALIESGVITEVERRSNGAGRPTMAYKLVEG